MTDETQNPELPTEPSEESPTPVPQSRPSLAELKARLKEKSALLVEKFRARMQATDVHAIQAQFQKLLQSGNAGLYGTIATLIASTYFLADVSSVLLERFIPEPPTVRLSSGQGGFRRAPTPDDFAVIWNRNLFNSRGLLPGEAASEGASDQGGAPVRTSLPLSLVGTLILRDEIRSIATIEDKTSRQVFPVRIEDEIPGKARILTIEARRVIFVNTVSGRREFIELPLDNTNALTTSGAGAAPKGGSVQISSPGIEKLSANQFNLPRNEVDKALADLNQVLTQARAIPHFENGVAAGYKLFQIVPGSIYEKLGLQNGDLLCGLNGAPINDPAKAFEMLNELKSSSHLELCVKRDGRQSNFAYEIR